MCEGHKIGQRETEPGTVLIRGLSQPQKGALKRNDSIALPEVKARLCLVVQWCPALCDPMDCSPPGSSVHGDSPVKNTGVRCHTLCQGLFPTQGLSPGLPHHRWILCHLSHQGSVEARGQGLLPQTLRVAPNVGAGGSLQSRAIEPTAVSAAGLWGSLGPDRAPEWHTAISSSLSTI